MNKMEILAPAGGPESVLPAVRCGADAIYLGAWSLSARASAQNFDREQLRQAVEYCHARGVKVYLACNILMFDNELKRAMEIIEYACSIPVDALIMQDVGLVSLVREAAPDMRIHASTQMSVHTPKGVELLSKMGFKRVVLSRELSRDEIYEIAKNSPIELEVFVHGALCMSVSVCSVQQYVNSLYFVQLRIAPLTNLVANTVLDLRIFRSRLPLILHVSDLKPVLPDVTPV